jgi:hypothetical protein
MLATLLIIDHHEGFRFAASALLEAEAFMVVGGVADGRAALGDASLALLAKVATPTGINTPGRHANRAW